MKNQAGDAVEVVFSFDTTGSMYPCLSRVRKKLKQTITRLAKEIPGIRIGLVAHGCYCDQNIYKDILASHPLSEDVDSLCSFAGDVPPTNGDGAHACYEMVLRRARSFDWTSSKARILVLIGDEPPYRPDEYGNKLKLDWRNEVQLLQKMGVQVYGVQALDKEYASYFYSEIARVTGGEHLTLDQFESALYVIMGICYKQAGVEKLREWEDEVARSGAMDRSMDRVFARLQGRKPKFSSKRTDGLSPVKLGRFQVMSVEGDESIKDFVEGNGIPFQKGRGFYEFTKPEDVQEYKEVILRDNNTGDFFEGKQARGLLSLPSTGTVRVHPRSVPSGYAAFIQSTSYNRKLIAGTKFLYEVDSTK